MRDDVARDEDGDDTDVQVHSQVNRKLAIVVRLDEEHALLLAKKSRSGDIRFRLEAHIFFDDAWEDQQECGRAPNAFFRTFFQLITELTSLVFYKGRASLRDEDESPATRILVNTSYGGRLVVRLPAGTLLFVHLKDKKLIRHKKRWSQVKPRIFLTRFEITGDVHVLLAGTSDHGLAHVDRGSSAARGQHILACH